MNSAGDFRNAMSNEQQGSSTAGARSYVANPTKIKKALPPWRPQVSLIPHTTAPLACRISSPPLSQLLPKSLEPKPLKLLSVEEQEAVILDDLLFVFMGYEGQYVRFASSYDPSIEKERLIGPSYKLLPGLDPSLRDLTQSVLKIAKKYKAMEAFVEVISGHEYGATNHALCASIRKIFKDYFVLIVQLEHQLISNPSFTLHLLHLHTLPTNQTMSQLYSLGHEILSRNALFGVEKVEEVVDDFDDFENILEKLRKGGELAPGGMTRKIFQGGNVLRLLTDRLSLMSGDPAARTLVQRLLRDASRPYMIMMNEWLHHGGISDPHDEFLVKEQTGFKREKLEEDFTDNYWEKRYTIRDEEVPPQLEGVKEKVLLAGKYLNVVRECGGVDVSKEVHNVPKSFDDPRFLENVNNAYAHANSSLLNLLLTTHGLSDRLRSLKYYFFLDRSDFFTYFLDLSFSELNKPWALVNVEKLQSLLDLVLRHPGSVAAQVPFKEDIKVQMSEKNLTKFLVKVINVKGAPTDKAGWSLRNLLLEIPFPAEKGMRMRGFESLQLKYSVPFPLSLVISSNTLLRYQVVFRHLLSLRHAEELLVNVWKVHHKAVGWTHRSKNPKLEMCKRRAWTLRAQMLTYIQQVTYYCTSEIIEPQWKKLMDRVDGTSDHSEAEGSPTVPRTVDELMKNHVDFLDTCLNECMLMNARLLRIQAKILNICQRFSDWTNHVTNQLCSADPVLAGSAPALAYLSRQFPSARYPIPEPLKTYDPTRLSKIEKMLTAYETNFNTHLELLLDSLDYYAATETVAMSRLCAHLSTAVGKRKMSEETRAAMKAGDMKLEDDGDGEGEV